MVAIENKNEVDVLLKLVMHDNKTKDFAKRIPFESITFSDLVEKSKTLAAKHEMLDASQALVITYDDKKQRSTVEVEDETDLELALT